MNHVKRIPSLNNQDFLLMKSMFFLVRGSRTCDQVDENSQWGVFLYVWIGIWVFPKNRGTPKWMVKIMENPSKMDDLGVPPIFGNTHINLTCSRVLCANDEDSPLKVTPMIRSFKTVAHINTANGSLVPDVSQS